MRRCRRRGGWRRLCDLGELAFHARWVVGWGDLVTVADSEVASQYLHYP